ncbi:uncharacterized protein THITE_115391 [Thermothielavioides terrestris NRRL 8126]|uniref:MYND-type domain-containing protein n=1 Tax=Thermothielavioides terrestris (strain ATCC 38088 / NRRL 8126) TaxID=578455 RepID=G2RCT7_THETT|nr:uncharacterized protein THITE_115391 [Thermothielavioides terrestris NRRL 8126]AEO69825.1 hypothetical protein THITE_115391 [Thermothielavioides terrestris NRRL 8126]
MSSVHPRKRLSKQTPPADAARVTQAPDRRCPSINIPMVCYHNYEALDHPHLHKICRIDREIQQRCIMCNNSPNPDFLCRDCKGAQYCSWECKVDDQQHHALVCGQWSSFAMGKRPNKDSARILIFPAKSATPVFAWARMTQSPGEETERLRVRHPEMVPFRTENIAPWTTNPYAKAGRIGCINECRALAARGKPLGHGLFVLEWDLRPPPGSDQPPSHVSIDWINKSIMTVTAPATGTAASLTDSIRPGHAWLWTGPIMVISLNLALTSAQAERHFVLDHVDLRDFRHAVDFFSLNLRNPCLPFAHPHHAPLSPAPSLAPPTTPPSRPQSQHKQFQGFSKPTASSHARRSIAKMRSQLKTNRKHLTAPSKPPAPSSPGNHPRPAAPPAIRFRLPTLPAIKLNEPHVPVMHALHQRRDPTALTPPPPPPPPLLEAVCISRDLPPPAGGTLQGVSALCARLGLAWVVRAVLAHGEELDWLYEGFYGAASAAAVAAGDGDGNGGGGSDENDNKRSGGSGDTEQGNNSIPTLLDEVLSLDEKTGVLQRRRLPRSGDGMVIFHGAGGRLLTEHVYALLRFIEETAGGVEQAEHTPEKFRAFWDRLKADDSENIPADIPSPYDLMPEPSGQSGSKLAERFVVCKQVFGRLVEENAPLA